MFLHFTLLNIGCSCGEDGAKGLDGFNLDGWLICAASLLSVSHQRMHQTNEFNCHLNALFMIDPTNCAALPLT
jgi:hypothetical protein